jgi:hypothetical protein
MGWKKRMNRVPKWKERKRIAAPKVPDYVVGVFFAPFKGQKRVMIANDTDEATIERDERRCKIIHDGKASVIKSEKKGFTLRFAIKGYPVSNMWSVYRVLNSDFDWIGCDGFGMGFPVDAGLPDTDLPKIAEYLMWRYAKKVGMKLRPVPSA